VTGIEEARRFLSPKLGDLHDPFGLPDMEKAVARIERAVRSKERIAIFGDYDVDGISSTCLLHDFFRFIDYPVAYRLPDRLLEGYGIRSDAVRELAAAGVNLIITVDNGSTAVREVEVARELGIDVVVTDHHQPGPVLPPAAAVVNPWAPGSTYPFQSLAGVGVAFKLVWALAQRLSRAKKLSPPFRDFLLESLALVALGTISDVVPLLGENRILAKFGLAALARTRRRGLRRLVSSVLRPGEDLDAGHIGFRIGPRINAAGRLGKADAAIRLLLTDDDAEADRLAAALDGENKRRQEIERRILDEAREQVRKAIDVERARAIVLGGEGWHPGVIGIVAARIAEEFCRPTVLLSLEGDRGRGSARSIAGVDILSALEACSSCLLGFGGHAMAAGLEVEARRLGEVREALNGAIPVAPLDMVPEIEADCEVRLSDLSMDALRELEHLEPHGHGNPEPVFFLGGIDVVGEPRVLGADSSHLAFHVRDRGAVRRAIAFGKGELYPRIAMPGARVSLLLEPQVSSWQGRSDIELRVRELRIH
jgi:single-stranded-DNA-specific exonuclease